MTVSSSTSTASYVGSDQSVLPLTFRFFDDSEILFYRVDPITGASTLQVLGVDYTLTGAGEPEVNGNAVGTIVLTAPLASGTNGFAERVLEAVQNTDLVNQGRFFPEVHEDSFDYLTMLIQQLITAVSNTIQAVVGGFGWDFLGKRGLNVGAPVDPADAANKGYVDAGDSAISSVVNGLNSKALRVPENVPVIVSAAARADKLLSFDSSGNPVAIAAANQSATDLELRLANSSDPAKGAAMLGRATIALDSVKDLLAAAQRTDVVYALRSWRPAQAIGGGAFRWSATTLKSTHNGGTVISPTVPWDGTTPTIGAFLAGTGETSPGGSGCFLRIQEHVETSPEIFGAVPSFSEDITASFQAAVFAAVNGECVLSAANYRTGPIKIKGFTRIRGAGKGSAVILANSAATHLFTENDPAVDTNIEIVSLRINGNRGNQTLANDAIHFTSTLPGIGLTRHYVHDLWITNVKGNGIYMDTFCRESLVSDVNLSDCDGNGIFGGWSDGQISNAIVGRSGLSGVVIRQGLLVDNVKSWFSGRIDLTGSGFEIRDADNAKLTNCWSQENKGHGFDIQASAGTVKNLALINCTADSDNTSASSKNGFNIIAASNSVFDIVVRTFPGSSGSPQIGIQIGNSTTDCEITGTVTGAIGRAVEANLSAGNTIDVNGRRGRVRQITYAATVSNDPWTQETIRIPLTGNILIDNPQRNPHGLILRYILNQDPTGGRVTTFGTAFKFNWTPDTAANKTNVITFLCDGTNWIQIASATGI